MDGGVESGGGGGERVLVRRVGVRIMKYPKIVLNILFKFFNLKNKKKIKKCTIHFFNLIYKN